MQKIKILTNVIIFTIITSVIITPSYAESSSECIKSSLSPDHMQYLITESVNPIVKGTIKEVQRRKIEDVKKIKDISSKYSVGNADLLYEVTIYIEANSSFPDLVRTRNLGNINELTNIIYYEGIYKDSVNCDLSYSNYRLSNNISEGENYIFLLNGDDLTHVDLIIELDANDKVIDSKHQSITDLSYDEIIKIKTDNNSFYYSTLDPNSSDSRIYYETSEKDALNLRLYLAPVGIVIIASILFLKKRQSGKKS